MNIYLYIHQNCYKKNLKVIAYGVYQILKLDFTAMTIFEVTNLSYISLTNINF